MILIIQELIIRNFYHVHKFHVKKIYDRIVRLVYCQKGIENKILIVYGIAATILHRNKIFWW